MFGKKKNKVKVKFEVEALRVLNLPSKLNGREVRLAWSKGKRKSNRGESEAAVVHDGTANFDYRFTIEASMAQDAAQQFESKKIAFYIRDDKKSKVGKETLDLAAFAKEGQQANHNLALGKKNPPVLMLNLKASWLKFNGKFILRDSATNPAPSEAGAGRDTLDIDGQEFQLRTADVISEADTSCYTDTGGSDVDADGMDELAVGGHEGDEPRRVKLASSASASASSSSASSVVASNRSSSAREIPITAGPLSSRKSTTAVSPPKIVLSGTLGGGAGSVALASARSATGLGSDGSASGASSAERQLRKDLAKLAEKHQKKKSKLDEAKKKAKALADENARLKEEKARAEKALDAQVKGAEEEARKREKVAREAEDYRRRAKESEDDAKAKGKELEEVRKRARDVEEDLRKRTRELGEAKDKLRDYDEVRERLRVKEDEARKRTKECEEAIKKAKDLKEKVATLTQSLKEAEETRREKSGVAEEERKRWRDKEESLTREHEAMEARLRDTEERFKRGEREIDEIRKRECEMEDIITRLTDEVKSERANAERALEQSKAAVPVPSSSSGKRSQKAEKTPDFDFPIIASGPVLTLDATCSESPFDSDAALIGSSDFPIAATVSAPLPVANSGAGGGKLKSGGAKRDRSLSKKKQQLLELERRVEEGEDTIQRLKQELDEARAAAEEARRERREAERRMREERERERDDEQRDRGRERGELEEQIVKLRTCVEDEKRRQRALEEKLRKKDKKEEKAANKAAGKGSLVSGGSGVVGALASSGELERLRGELEAKERRVQELERRWEERSREMEEREREMTRTREGLTQTGDDIKKLERKYRKARRELSSYKEGGLPKMASGDGDGDEKKKQKQNSGEGKAVRDKSRSKGKAADGEGEGEKEAEKQPVSWQEKAMRLKGKLHRIEAQLARERKEKEHINDILAKRDDELAHLQRQLAPIFGLDPSGSGSGLDERLLLEEGQDGDGGLPLAIAERLPTATIIARSRRPPKTFLTPFFEWWKDINGRPDGAMGDLNLKAWWTAVVVLLLSVFLQLWWRTTTAATQAKPPA